MKKFIVKSTLVALALSVAACSSTPVRRSMKETWNDSLTASKIRYKMMRDSEVSKSHTHVEVFRGQVTLTGRSTTDAEKARAETLAKSVKRVTGVENYVHVVGGSDTAVAKASVSGASGVAVSAKAGTAPSSVIKEKTIVADKAKVSEDDALATLPTIRESTGNPAAAPIAPVAASRKVAATKGVTPVAKTAKLAPGKSNKSETTAAAVRKTPAPLATAKAPAPVISVKSPVPMTAANESIPVISAPQMAKSATPDQSPVSKVVGRSKTGLPWDGEVYEDDATRISSPAKAAPAATATRIPVAAPASAPSPAVAPASTSGDDLAKEAAQELEKLRLKK